MLTKCDACTLDGKKVPWQRPPNPQYPILFVGQAPGSTEVLTKVPFTGSAGKMLYSLMLQAGLVKKALCITNVCCCKPPSDVRGNDRAPTPLEVQCCEPRLKREIHELRPELIIALGGPALETLTGKGSILSQRGTFHPLDKRFEYECQVLACLHPSFVMRRREYVPIAVQDLKLVTKYLMGEVAPEVEVKFILDPSAEELKRYLFDPKKRVCAFDTETTGLNKRQDKVLGASFSNSTDTACAVYLINEDSRLEVIKEFLQDLRWKKVTQNGSFDCEIIFNNWHIEVKGLVHDTRLAEQLLNPDMPKDLDHLRSVYTRIRPYKPAKKEMRFIGQWGTQRMLEYAAWDAVTTFQVYKAQTKVMTKGLDKVMQTRLIPIVPILNEMERIGIRVNVPRLAVMNMQYGPIIEELEREIYEESGINPHSPKQVAEYFGLKSADKEALELLVNRGHPQSELVEKIIQVRKLHRDVSTYLLGVYHRLEGERIHTEYYPEGTGTGRLSSSNPNLQNVPKEMRVIYEADPGHILVAGDYSHAELWALACLAPCEVLLNDLKNHVDVHGRVQAAMEPYIPEDQKHRSRVLAKSVVFGSVYQRGPRSIARTFGCSVSTAEAWQAALFNTYPGIGKYQEDRIRDWRDKGYVTTPFGRWRKVETSMQACNTPIQSTVADIVLQTMILTHGLEDCQMLLQVHDEIVYQAPAGKEREAVKRLKEIFERPIPELNGVRFPAAFKVGTNWYQMEEVKID